MQVTLTDDDIIEKSNLSRQFLFRDWDLKQAKSTAAARAAIAINPAFHVSPQVSPSLHISSCSHHPPPPPPPMPQRNQVWPR
jgi:molybdopterin/thiamine biosynthesis adenylyltransferase